MTWCLYVQNTERWRMSGGVAGLYDLKDEKQAQEYLDRIGIEYRFQCYHENLPEGCHRLADFLEAFRQVH